MFSTPRTPPDPYRPIYRWKARSWLFPAVHAEATRAQAHGRYTRRRTRIFAMMARVAGAAISDLHGAARAARAAREARLNRPVRAAALLRRNSRLCRRLAA